MAKIYKITNSVNGKVYIGKTLHSLEKRLKEHFNDSKQKRVARRPLYSAILKYGIESFSIELLEETCEEFCSDREIYWIAYFDAYTGGYNATKGGDGKSYIDRQRVLDMYKKTNSGVETQRIMGCSYSTVLNILKDNGVVVGTGKRATKRVRIIQQSNAILFESLTDAARHLISLGLSTSSPIKIASKISLVCRGLRKSAYGLRFEYA